MSVEGPANECCPGECREWKADAGPFPSLNNGLDWTGRDAVAQWTTEPATSPVRLWSALWLRHPHHSHILFEPWGKEPRPWNCQGSISQGRGVLAAALAGRAEARSNQENISIQEAAQD